MRATCSTRCRRSTPTRFSCPSTDPCSRVSSAPSGRTTTSASSCRCGSPDLHGSHRLEPDAAHQVLTDAPVQRLDDSRSIHLQLMRQRAVGGGDDEHAAIETLSATHGSQSITDDVRERESQTLLAHLDTDTEPAQRGVDEVRQTLLGHRPPSSVSTPPLTLTWRTSSKSPTSVSGPVVVTST